MKFNACCLLASFAAGAAPASAQVAPMATLQEMTASPLIRLNIAETLRTRPDEASLSIGTQSKAPTATAAVAANKVKTERLLQTIRSQGIRDRDMQTQGIQLQADYQWVRSPIDGSSSQQKMVGYVVSNTIQIKTRDIRALTKLLDVLSSAGADSVYGPTFSISDPAPLRRTARQQALARGEAEALEYARNRGFTSVALLSVEEGTSYRGTDVARLMTPGVPPPPPPPPPLGAPRGERDNSDIVAPGQLEAGVTLNLIYRMQR